MGAPLIGRPPEEVEWQDLLARRTTGGLYAVGSTGIVCAFGCPSPPPKRANTCLPRDLEEALSAGYRPCKRCGAGWSKLSRIPPP